MNLNGTARTLTGSARQDHWLALSSLTSCWITREVLDPDPCVYKAINKLAPVQNVIHLFIVMTFFLTTDDDLIPPSLPEAPTARLMFKSPTSSVSHGSAASLVDQHPKQIGFCCEKSIIGEHTLFQVFFITTFINAFILLNIFSVLLARYMKHCVHT